VKYQLLHVLKNTDLETLYEEGKIHALTLDAYVDLVAACIASTDPSVILMRLSGDGDPEELVAPLWSLAKRQVLNRIQHELKTRNITQGCWLPL
jgi:radical SAM superfamily enzyme